MILPLDNDSQYEDAARLVELYQFASCSFLQRQLQIGFSEALQVIEMLALDNLLPTPAQRFAATDFRSEWLASHAFAASPNLIVPADFFEVATGICFSDEDLYLALLANRDAVDVRLSYSMGKADAWQRGSDANPAVDSVLKDIRAWPADGLAIKITVSPRQLLGRDLTQICSTLLQRVNKHCSSALAIQYSESSDELLIEIIASKIFTQ